MARKPSNAQGSGPDPERIQATILAGAKMLQARACETSVGRTPLLELGAPDLDVEGFRVFITVEENVGPVVTVSTCHEDFECFRTMLHEMGEGRAAAVVRRHLVLSPSPARRLFRKYPFLDRRQPAMKGRETLLRPVALLESHDEITNHELMILEVTAAALTEYAGVLRATAPQEPCPPWTGVVAAAGAPLRVHLRPYLTPTSVEPVDGTFDLRAARWAKPRVLDAQWAMSFHEEVVRRFVESSRKKGIATDGLWVQTLLSHSVKFIGHPVGMIGPAQLRKLLFELLPLKYAFEAAQAPALVEELRDFYRWAKEEHGFEPAADCLAMLHPSVEVAVANTVQRRAEAPGIDLIIEAARRLGVQLESPQNMAKFVAESSVDQLDALLGKLSEVVTEQVSAPPGEPGENEPGAKNKGRKETAH